MTRNMGSSIRVLHVDDDPAFLELAATFLERAGDGFEVVTASSAVEGYDVLEREPIDCLVSDHDMPDWNGIEFLQTVREEHPDLPFILFTGKGSEEVASRAVSAGVTDYLQKETGTDQYTILANRIENAVERDRSQRAVTAQKRRLETLVDNVPGVVYRCRNEPGWPMEYLGGECESLTGHPADRLESGEITWGEDVIHPDDRDPVRETVQTSIAADEPFEDTYRIRTADGDTKWVWERGRGVPDDDVPDTISSVIDANTKTADANTKTADANTKTADANTKTADANTKTADANVEFLEGFITDVTDRKERERELQRYERLFEAVFHDPNVLVGLLAPDGTVRTVNRTALKYVDADREAIVGEPFSETPWWPDDRRTDVREWIERAAAGEYVEYEATHPTEDGSPIVVEGTFRPVVDDGDTSALDGDTSALDEGETTSGDTRADHDRPGSITGIVVSAKDVTERRRREREVKRQADRLDEFASAVSHDLRSPISAVDGRLDLALETGDREHIERAAEAIDRVDDLREDIVATLRSGEIVSEREPVLLEEAVESALIAVDPPASTDVTVDDVEIEADPDAFARLLENLLRNSVEHGGASVTVRFGRLGAGDAESRERPGGPGDGAAGGDTRTTGSGIVYEDDGPGIDPADRDRVFTPGFTTKTDGDGIGMGMASVRQIVAAHGWSIRITDATVLDGVRFEIRTE
ncbi:response regulator [Halopenitus persicus]|uniref:response regulator n=1 Tax=Halopenitus persicus TaxID=1048396 RepID=UPI0018EE7BAD|nr:response regulator [Halopenitus persicus]